MSGVGLFTGIDIQERAAHAARVRITSSGAEFVACRSIDLPPSDQEPARADALREFLRPFRGGRIAAVLPDRDIISHTMMLPTADRAELPSMAAFAMEQRALAASELRVTHCALDASQPGGTLVNLFAAPAASVDALRDALNRCGAAPHAVIPSGAAVARFFSKSASGNDALIAVHFQDESATVFLITAAGPHAQRYVSLHGLDAADRLVALISSIRLCAADADAPPATQIILFGSDAGNHRDAIERALDIPVSVSTGAEAWPEQSAGAAQRAAGAALELALSSGAGPDLLPESKNVQTNGRGSKWLAAATAFILIAITACGVWTSLSAQRIKSRELSRLDRRIGELRPRIEDMQKKKKLAAAYRMIEPGGVRCLDVLKELSVVLPDSNIYVTGLGYESSGRLTLTAETTDAYTAPRAIAALNRSPLFSDVTLGYAHKKDRDENIVEFEARARVREDMP